MLKAISQAASNFAVSGGMFMEAICSEFRVFDVILLKPFDKTSMTPLSMFLRVILTICFIFISLAIMHRHAGDIFALAQRLKEVVTRLYTCSWMGATVKPLKWKNLQES
jgi:hypothetical protein